MKNRMKPCEVEEKCPFCAAGIPKKVMLWQYDHTTGENILVTLSEETYRKIFGDQNGKAET